MKLAIEVDGSGGAVLAIDVLDRDAVDVFVERVSSLVQDRDDVRRVDVRCDRGEPSALLRYLVSVLDRQARLVGKTVDLAAPGA